MMHKLLVGLLLLVAQLGPTYSGSVIDDNSVISTGAAGGNQPSAGCAQSTTFLARTTGLSGTETTAYTNFICGLVTDGVITGNMGSTGCGSPIDALYIFATKDTTTAHLNLCGTSFTLSETATINFSADNGYTNVSGFLDTGYNPATAGSTCGNGAAACAYSLNSVTLGTYQTTNRTASSTNMSIGACTGAACATTTTQLLPYFNGNGQRINSNACNVAFIPSQAQAGGMSIMTRTSSSRMDFYQFGSGGPFVVTATTNCNSTSIPSINIYIAARNVNGTADAFYTDQLVGALIGGQMTQATAVLVCTRFNNFAIDIGNINFYASCT